jgi:hypothetical protein
MESFKYFFRSNLLNFAYIGCCLLLSLPFFTAVLTIVDTHKLPSGLDNPVHAFFIKRMLDTGNPLVEYTPFSDLRSQDVDRYYPSFMHIILSISLYVTGFTSSLQIIAALNVFIILISIVGAIGFSLLVRELLKISMFSSYKVKINEFEIKVRVYFILLCVLVFGILIFSTFLIIKTINDGTYAEVFAMWALFPFYLIFLLRNNWIKAGILLSVIAATHNLSLIMVIAVTVAYLTSFLINKRWGLLKRSTILFITFGVLSIPSFILFYIPTIQGVAGGTAGDLQLISQEALRELLSPLLYYSAIAVSIVLLIANYQRLSWYSIWIVMYFVLMSFFPILSSRVARESPVEFGLIIGICLAYSINMMLYSKKFRKFVKCNMFFNVQNLRIIIVLAAIAIILPIYYNSQYGRLLSESNPFLTYFYSDAQNESYRYLLSSYIDRYGNDIANTKENIILYGYSPWLKTILYDQFNVYEALAKDFGDQMSLEDKEINDDLLHIIKNPAGQFSACVLKKFNIDYLYIADNLAYRFYTPHQFAVFYEELHLLRFFNSPFFNLEKEFHGDFGERVQIYGVNKINMNKGC